MFEPCNVVDILTAFSQYCVLAVASDSKKRWRGKRETSVSLWCLFYHQCTHFSGSVALQSGLLSHLTHLNDKAVSSHWQASKPNERIILKRSSVICSYTKEVTGHFDSKSFQYKSFQYKFIQLRCKRMKNIHPKCSFCSRANYTWS